MLRVPSCAILLSMSFFSCSVTQNSIRIGLVRSAIKTLPSIYNGHFLAHWGGTPRKFFSFSFHPTTDIFVPFLGVCDLLNFRERHNSPHFTTDKILSPCCTMIEKLFLPYNGHFRWKTWHPFTIQRTIFG